MKRSLGIILILAVIVGCIYWFFFRIPQYRAEEILSSDTLIFVSSSNFSQTQANLALCPTGRMLKEPSVKKFVLETWERTLSNNEKFAHAAQNNLGKNFGRVLKEVEGSVFIAVTDFYISPKLGVDMVIGFERNPKASDAFQKWVDELRIEQPSTQVETLEWDGMHYELLTLPQRQKIAYLKAGNWMLVSWGENALRTVISNIQNKSRPSLAKHPFLLDHLLPPETDLKVFINPQPIWSQLKKFGVLQSEYSEQLKPLLALDHILYASSYKKSGVESRMWIRRNSESKKSSSLSATTLSFTTADTLFYGAMTFDLKSLDSEAFAKALKSPKLEFLQKSMPSMDPATDLFKWMGNEVALVLNWPQTHEFPSFCAVLHLTHPVEMENALKKMTAALPRSERGAVLPGLEVNGKKISVYTLPIAGMNLSGAVLDPYLVLTPVGSDLRSISTDFSVRQKTLERPDWFKGIQPKLPREYRNLVYLNLKQVVDRFYPSLRETAIRSKEDLPKISSSVDLQLLPAAEQVSKHLSAGFWVGGGQQRDDEYLCESSLSISALALGLWLESEN